MFIFINRKYIRISVAKFVKNLGNNLVKIVQTNFQLFKIDNITFEHNVHVIIYTLRTL